MTQTKTKTPSATTVAKEDFAKYLNEAKGWETDKVRKAEASEKRAWIVASIASVAAVGAIFSVAALVPLKETIPYVIRVDNSTGITDVATALKDGKTNYDEVMSKYFLKLYIRYREGYSRPLAEEYYSNVGLMSGPQEAQKYAAYFNPKNPLSPLSIYGTTAKVKTDIKSVSFINPTIALVRYTKTIERGLDSSQVTHWTATMTFKYNAAPMKEKDRAINPLGFQVTEYRNDPDSDTSVAPVANSAATPEPTDSPAAIATAGQVVPALQQ